MRLSNEIDNARLAGLAATMFGGLALCVAMFLLMWRATSPWP